MTAISHQDDGRAGPPLAGQGQPDSTTRSERRDWLSSAVVQGLLAFGLYLAVWVPTAVHSLAHHPGRALLDQKSMDPNFYTWCLRWWPYAIGHGLNPLFTHEIGAPAGHTLAWVTTVPPLALLATPLTFAAGPVVSFSVLTAIAPPLAAWAAFVLCRRLTGKFWPGLLGGAVFGFSAYEMNHSEAGQLNLIYCLLLPLMAYLVVLWRDESIGARTFVILMGITMGVQFYLFLETFADMTAILALSLLVGFALAGRDGRPQMLRLTRLTALAYVLAIVLAAPYLRYALATKPPKLVAVTGMDLVSLVVPRPGRTLGIAWLAHEAIGPVETSQACYVGIPLIVVAILLAVTSRSSRTVRFLSVMLVLIMVAAIGPEVYLDGRPVARLPWARLFSLPIVRNAYPSRLMLFAFLILAVTAALWLAGPAQHIRWVDWARWPLAILVIAAIALDVPPMKISPATSVPAFISSGQYRQQLTPGEIVVVVSNVGNAGMLWQAQSGFYMRLSGGFINAGINHLSDLPPPVQDLKHATPARVARFEAYVKTNKIGAILLDVKHEPRWVAIFQQLGLVGHRTGGVLVYRTLGCQSCHALDWAQLGKHAPATT